MTYTIALKQKIDMATPNLPYDREDIKDSYGRVIGYKKWNDLYKRYDVYNSNNQLVGYYKWSDLYNRWEYHEN